MGEMITNKKSQNYHSRSHYNPQSLKQKKIRDRFDATLCLASMKAQVAKFHEAKAERDLPDRASFSSVPHPKQEFS